MKKIGMTFVKEVIASYIISGILLLILAGIMLKSNLGTGAVKNIMVGIYIISTFAGGFIIGKVMENKKYLWGLASGALYFAILMLVSAVIEGQPTGASLSVGVCLVTCLVSGTVGGMAG